MHFTFYTVWPNLKILSKQQYFLSCTLRILNNKYVRLIYNSWFDLVKICRPICCVWWRLFHPNHIWDPEHPNHAVDSFSLHDSRHWKKKVCGFFMSLRETLRRNSYIVYQNLKRNSYVEQKEILMYKKMQRNSYIFILSIVWRFVK